jgi:hypothetical protein
MSFATYNDRVKNTQKIIDAYLGTDLVIGSHDPFTMIDQLRSYLGYDPLFDGVEGATADLSALFASLQEIATRSAIVGDIAAIKNDETYALGVVLGHDYSLFVTQGNVFGVASNKSLSKAFRVGGEH